MTIAEVRAGMSADLDELEKELVAPLARTILTLLCNRCFDEGLTEAEVSWTGGGYLGGWVLDVADTKMIGITNDGRFHLTRENDVEFLKLHQLEELMGWIRER